MRKLFSLMAATLLSVAMIAGENDLLWDYTEAAPTANPDNGLYYGAKVDDGEKDKDNHLNGVKLNNGGWAYFEKANVAGKLKLTFANRKAQTAYAVSVYNATKAEGANPVKGTKIADTEEVDFGGYATIELPAEVTGVFIERLTPSEGVLTKIEFKENVARSFVDFKVDFRPNPYSIVLPEGGLPAGVEITGTWHDSQHGYSNATVTVPVDGPVKFTIGSCTYTNKATVTQDGVDLITEIDTKSGGCDDGTHYDHFATYTYTGGPTTLYFNLGSYCPYFFAEACEITPCTITFKDQNGGTLGTVETIEGATLEEIPYTVEDLPTFPDAEAFRGWFYMSGKKAKVGDPINGNTTISAKVTPVEYATVGSIQTYDFTNPYFYPEDHETILMEGGYYHDGTHGWAFVDENKIKLQLAGNAVVVLEICQYGKENAMWTSWYDSAAGSQVNTDHCPAIGNEGEQFAFLVTAPGPNTLGLMLVSNGENYLHKITVYNVENFIEKNETTGYIMVPAGDAAAFVLALAQAQSGDKVFLPNGTYDLGETVLTTISKNNISLIGQSMDGTIIKNAPDAKTESIDKTATLRIAKNVTGTYIQDLTIQNALDYYKSDNGRAVALWDQGTKTVCKNVKLLSYQDTYYSNLQGAVKYFEDCEIHGTVDFICGDGSVYFKNNLLYAEKRKKDGGGSDALTANNGPATDKGYVFEGCTIKSACPTVSFGRAWNNKPTTTFLNTLVDYEAGQFSFSDGDKIQRWTKELMNANAWPQFGEYNTHLADGTVLTPASNQVTFVDTKSGNATQTLETVLSADQAAAFTMEYTLGEWSATAKVETEQKRMNVMIDEAETMLTWNATEEGIYMVCLSDVPFITTEMSLDLTTVNWNEVIAKFHEMYGDDIAPTGGYYVRFANGRGGFGYAVWPGETPEGLERIQQSSGNVRKIMRNGQVIIVRDGREYTILGTEL